MGVANLYFYKHGAGGTVHRGAVRENGVFREFIPEEVLGELV